MSDQSENNKRIAKNTLLLYFRMMLTMAVSLYTSRVVLKTLGVEDYGIYNVVGGVVVMFTFINNAMANATQRFLTYELGKNNFKELHNVFCTSMTIHILISLIIIVLAETIGLWFLNTHMVIPENRMNAAHWVYQFSVFSTVIMMISVPYNASIIAHERMSAFAYISILEVLLKLIIVYILQLLETDKLKLYAILIFTVQLLIRFTYNKYCKKSFDECHFKFNLNKYLFKKMFSFAIWSMFGNLAVVALNQGVNILLNTFFGPTVNAARAITIQIQHAVQGFIANFQTAINPQITKQYACGNLHQMHKLLFASSRFSFYLLLFLTLPLVIKTEFVLSIWLTIVPKHTVNFVRLIFCIMLIEALVNPLTIAAQATGKIKKYQIVVGGLQLLILPLSYLALKNGPFPEIVFITHLVIAIIAQITRIYMLKNMIALSPLIYFKTVIMRIITVCIVSIIMPLMVYLYLPQSSFLSFSILCVISWCSVALIGFFLGLEKEERVYIAKKINKYRLKIITK